LKNTDFYVLIIIFLKCEVEEVGRYTKLLTCNDKANKLPKKKKATNNKSWQSVGGVERTTVHSLVLISTY
jgi:hypothetical protein